MIRRHRGHTRSCNGGEEPLGGTTELYASQVSAFGFRLSPQLTRNHILLLLRQLEVSDEVRHVLAVSYEVIRRAAANLNGGAARRQFEREVFDSVRNRRI